MGWSAAIHLLLYHRRWLSLPGGASPPGPPEKHLRRARGPRRTPWTRPSGFEFEIFLGTAQFKFRAPEA
eukprot:3247234-Alexandrium_andersonii.AAC.1